MRIIEVDATDEAMRLDRWFKNRYPDIGHGQLEKLIRTGQIRIGGQRVKAATRVKPGDQIRVPPFKMTETRAPKARPTADADALEAVRSWVIYRDDDVIAINKPPGIAVQGGTGTTLHIDALLDGLQFDSIERPRLVHRLDRDTSGVLLLARNAPTARALAAAFRSKTPRKLYWTLVAGAPKRSKGRIDMAIEKVKGRGGERMSRADDTGKPAQTDYRVIEAADRRIAWLAMMPATGRTHQLRVHCAEGLKCPIVGDAKYGGGDLGIVDDGLERRLHLHARAIQLPHPNEREGNPALHIRAPLPLHMETAWKKLGFDEHNGAAEFDGWKT